MGGLPRVSRAERRFWEVLESVEARPDMYFRDRNLQELESWLDGYEAGLVEFGGSRFFGRPFAQYLYETRSWSGACGWAYAIQQRASSPDEAVKLFFELAWEYRARSRGPG